MAQWQHNPITERAGTPHAEGKPVAFAWEHDHTQHIVYRGTDSNIHELWFKRDLTGGHWNYNGQINVKAGAPVYACALGPLFCRRVGSIVGLLAGEMAYKHPLHNSQLRGQPVQFLAKPFNIDTLLEMLGGKPN